jgi:predicted enzyme related to lactoylglutathione lyase
VGRPIHFELAALDPQRAVAFYRAVFGWDISTWGGPMEYYLIHTGDPKEPGIDGAIAPSTDGTVGTTMTIGVPSLDAAVEAVTNSGGTVLFSRHAVPGVGYLAYCKDTEGNVIGLMQEDASAT